MDVRTDIDERGLLIINDAIPRYQIDKMREITLNNLNLGFKSSNGISIPDHLSYPEFEYFKFIFGNDEIRKVLNALTNNDYRFVEHNDIGIGRCVGWHKDRLNGKYRQYEIHHPWERVTGDEFRIYKVLIYLQDTDDFQYIEGSHINPKVRPINPKTARIKKGDVLVFDQRITHRGSETKNTDRILVSYGFGKNNSVFTDEFEKGTVHRQNDQKERVKR